MANVKPITELQRNITRVAEECHESQQPIYLTKNGAATLVVMDAAAFDREMSLHNDVFDREMRVYKSLIRGFEDVEAGHVRSLTQARKDAKQLRGQA